MMDDIEALERDIAEQEQREKELAEEQKKVKECFHCKEKIEGEYYQCRVHRTTFCVSCFLGDGSAERNYADIAKCEPHAPVAIMGMASKAVRKRQDCEFHKYKYLIKGE